MNQWSTDAYGPWDQFWETVVPWGRLGDPDGIVCIVFWGGVVALFLFALIKKSIEVYLMLAAWLIAFGGLLCFQGMVGTFQGSHDFWKHAVSDLGFLFGGFCVRTFGILFLCGIPVFWRQSLEVRKIGWMLLPILSILFLLAFNFLVFGLLWEGLLATRFRE